MEPEIVVVGASPAGLSAALTAAQSGVRVTLLERSREIGVPASPAALAFDFLWDAAERPPAGCVRRRLAGVRLASPRDDEHALEVAAPLSILHRTRYDQHLAERAAKAGADVRTGVAGLRVDAQDRALDADGGFRVRPAITIFADGASSLARAYLRPTRDPHALRWGAALEFGQPGARDETHVTIRPGAHAHGGRSQLNPLEGDRWSFWTFYRGEPREAEARAREALALEARLRGWPGDLAKRATLTAVAPDPVHTLPRELVADGVMVAGGAAGQGGIEVGVASGGMAGEAAAAAVLAGRTDEAALRPYEIAWKERYLAGYKALRRAADRLARLDDAHLDKLLAPWAGWRVPVRDVVGLAHPSPLRRVEALAKFAARNPHAVPRTAIVAMRAVLRPAGRWRDAATRDELPAS